MISTTEYEILSSLSTTPEIDEQAYQMELKTFIICGKFLRIYFLSAKFTIHSLLPAGFRLLFLASFRLNRHTALGYRSMLQQVLRSSRSLTQSCVGDLFFLTVLQAVVLPIPILQE